ncbi:hypothetical protein [Marinomonas mediterranea]|jgi:hypothetical protein|uniref:Lipocalin-like domain-containing protein n=1 Tax=Marinomonas mediterranea (strain ATCC 700492 / JCM 21426 / NBRC 103028 / MMB-1) TaxID=717774 RepID=F2K046_MARM1|nr:hypothetical protein [Marinomonas mediterranea]ADZ93260.1 hypothetical protein Marme_4052 [Marinomonas mediterranea MMB-1]WCN11148.1 hypothetical protein GV055_20535 [Marinomonas mediterranea]WCN15211.1 hypothetical protein GV054_20455 [Marinomonas mediterranea]WCN19255.1 hypothetical protein GV053_20515 [Marinomonas mediterranea MMB-1]
MKRMCFAMAVSSVVTMSSFVSVNALAAPPIEGAWQLSQAGDISKQLENAVEEVVSDMNFFVRSFARPVLKKETKVCQTWQILLDSKTVLWQCDDESASELPANALRYETKAEDDKDRTIYNTVQFDEKSLTIELASERGTRTNYWLLTDPNTLEYTATLESEKLPKPLTWTLTYKR